MNSTLEDPAVQDTGVVDPGVVDSGVDEVREAAEQELASSLEAQFASLAGNVPIDVAEAAESVANRIYLESVGTPDVQARAGTVRAEARGYVDVYRLSERQSELDSYLLAAGGVPDAVAERADREAGLVFDRNADKPELRTRAADLRAQALGYLDDWSGAVDWGQRAVDLAPGSQVYRQNLDLASANLERIPGGKQ